jgi:rod shape-determining protein MreB
MSMGSKKISIDLGTVNTLVYVPHKGIIINEPSVLAVSLDNNHVVAVGTEAKKMIGRTPDVIVAVEPIKEGVIADFRMTEAMIRYFIKKAMGKVRLFRPEIMVSVPAGITSTERRAVIEAVLKAGAKAAYVAKEPVLAAIGAGIPINEPSGHMIIDVGGGTTEVAVISLGGIVAWASSRVGGKKIDLAIQNYIHKVHNLAVGERTAEEIKIAIGSAIEQKDNDILEIRGRDLVAGLPKTIELKSNEIPKAAKETLEEIIKTIKKVLQQTPPELAADIMDKGMVLSGGTALLYGIDNLITQETGVPCYIADEAMLCVAKGAGIALDNLDLYKRALFAKK